MKTCSICAAVALSLACASTLAYSQTALEQTAQAVVAQTEPSQLQTTVVGFNHGGREMILRGPAGREVSLPTLVSPLTGQPVEVGQSVSVSYKSTLLLGAEKLAAGHDGIRENVDTVVYAAVPQGYEAAHQMTIKASVQKIDRTHRTLTLRGTRDVFTLPVAKDIDLDALHVGDMIQAVYVSVYTLG